MANYATGTGNTPIIIFSAHAQFTNNISYTPSSSYPGNGGSATDDWYDFVPINGNTSASAYINNQGSYALAPIIPPPPGPQINGFLVAVITTVGVTWQDIVGSMLMCYLLQNGITNAQLVTVWAVVSLFVTHPAQIVTYAVQYNIPT